jgi:hypothetical protein
MSRPLGMVCAAALLVAAAGCSASSFLLSFVSPSGKQQVVSGSVDQVAARLQGALSNAGFMVALSRHEQDVRLSGRTKTGKTFVLVLKRQKNDKGESTAISVEWVKDEDEQFWLTVVELLASPAFSGTAFSDAQAAGSHP